jgi:hypothetical protein
MKKLNLSLALIIILALVATACSLQIVPDGGPQQGPVGPQPGPQDQQPGPQGPQPGPQDQQPGPQGPQPGPGGPQPGPQGPQPGPQGPQPGPDPVGGNGGVQITFTADRTTLTKGQCATLNWGVQGGFGVKLNGQSVAQSGQQQVCPTSNTPYVLEVDTGGQMIQREVDIAVSGGGQSSSSGGWQPTATTKKKSGGGGNNGSAITPTTPGLKVIPITNDFQASDLSVDSGHYLHIYIVNNGNTSGNITFAITCTGLFTVTNGGSSTNIAYSTAKVTYDFTKVGARWINSKIKLDKGVGYYKLTCTISPDVLEANTSNNSVTKTVTIVP